jgi:hypothetical protein
VNVKTPLNTKMTQMMMFGRKTALNGVVVRRRNLENKIKKIKRRNKGANK